MSITTPTTPPAAIWRDRHSARRGHQLMTRTLAAQIPPIGANDQVADLDAIIVPAKLFSPYTGWRWYIAEWDGRTGRCFGLVQGFETELGSFDLTELSEATVLGGVPAVERDLYWTPKSLGRIERRSASAATTDRSNHA